MTSNLSSTVDPSMEPGFSPNSAYSPRYVRFGPFSIDQQRQQVYRAGSRLRLQGKVFQVLIVLLQKQGEVVSREELKQALWPADTHVNYDANVNTTVNKLRQALGESTEKPTYIETIPRKGYSFIGSAEFSEVPFPTDVPVPARLPGADSTAEPPSSLQSPSVENLSEEPAQPQKKWLTIVIVGLILAGMLIGAGAATFWIAHFAPQVRHSLSRQGQVAPVGRRF